VRLRAGLRLRLRPEGRGCTCRSVSASGISAFEPLGGRPMSMLSDSARKSAFDLAATRGWYGVSYRGHLSVPADVRALRTRAIAHAGLHKVAASPPRTRHRVLSVFRPGGDFHAGTVQAVVGCEWLGDEGEWFGCSPGVHEDFARALVHRAFTGAMPQHAGDNYRDPSESGPASWIKRPMEASRSIDVVAASPPLAATLRFDSVGLFGGLRVVIPRCR